MTVTMLSAPDIMGAARISHRQLDYWVRAGVLQPEVSHPGQGQPRRFAPIEALAARVCACVQTLAPHGIRTDLLCRIAAAVRTDTHETGWNECDIFVDADAVTLVVPITDPGP